MTADIFFLRTNEPNGYLSNFYPAKVVLDGIVYPTSEHCYQAQKATNREDLIFVAAQPSARDAKRAGYQIKLRDDWEDVKIDVMLKVLRLKFIQNTNLGKRLISTGDADLHENFPGDSYWSYNNGHGQDMLGTLLMMVRSELVTQPEYLPF
jgi:ribA/ribD-fused uncharacterized protein